MVFRQVYEVPGCLSLDDIKPFNRVACFDNSVLVFLAIFKVDYTAEDIEPIAEAAATVAGAIMRHLRQVNVPLVCFDCVAHNDRPITPIIAVTTSDKNAFVAVRCYRVAQVFEPNWT